MTPHAPDAPPLHIGLDISALRSLNTGTEEYLEGLSRGIHHAGLLVTGLGGTHPLVMDEPGLGQPVRPKPKPWEKWHWETRGLVNAAQSASLDLLHIPYLAHPPRTLSIPTVVTVLDLIPYRFPGYQRRLRDRVYFRAILRRLPLATHLVAISGATQHDLDILLPDLSPRVTVIPCGIHPDFFEPPSSSRMTEITKQLGLRDRPRILYIGGYQPHKNVGTLLKAAAKVCPHLDAELVLVGGRDHPDITRDVTALGLDQHTILTSRLPRKSLVALYHLAHAFAFPSRYEGFGLPPAQALAAGCPVVASTADAVSEVMGGAALLAHPDDVGQWVDHLETVLRDASVAKRLVASGIERATHFQWDPVAIQYRDLYRRITAR